jgi:hypothetical protein
VLHARVTAGGVSLLFGCSPFSIPARFHLAAIEWRDVTFARRTPALADLFEYDIEIRDLYHDFVERAWIPPVPKLRNSDGEDFVPTSMRYDLTMPVDEAFARLLPLATVRGEEHVDDVATGEGGAMSSAVLSWVKAGNRQMKDWDNTILGTLQLESGRVTAEVNSAKRADRLAKEIARRLGAGARLKLRSVENMQAHLAEMTARAARGEPGRPMPERTEEMLALEDEMYRRHLESWIDERVPALGNRTPRAVSRTARGRERIDALLAPFDTGPEADRPARREARQAMRRALGLEGAREPASGS